MARRAVCALLVSLAAAVAAPGLPSLDSLEQFSVLVHPQAPEWDTPQWDALQGLEQREMAMHGMEMVRRTWPISAPASAPRGTPPSPQRFMCFVPSQPDTTQPRGSSQTDAASSSAAEESPVQVAGDAVKEAVPDCLRKALGYWTYEVCPFATARQLHRGSGDEPPAPDTVMLLGSFKADSPRIAPRAGAGGAPAYTQSFTGGTARRHSEVHFVCAGGSLPPGVAADIVSVAEEAPLQYDITVAVEHAALCGVVRSGADLLRPVNGSCTSRSEGWWSYEVCVGGHLRQLHKERDAVTAEYTLGRMPEGGGTLEDTPSARLGAAEGAGAASETSLGPLTRGSLVPAALVQHFTGGTTCDMTGEPRQAEVRYVCAPEETLTLRSVREVATCQYVATVASMFVCAHEELGAGQEVERGDPTVVHCMPSADVPPHVAAAHEAEPGE